MDNEGMQSIPAWYEHDVKHGWLSFNTCGALEFTGSAALRQTATPTAGLFDGFVLLPRTSARGTIAHWRVREGVTTHRANVVGVARGLHCVKILERLDEQPEVLGLCTAGELERLNGGAVILRLCLYDETRIHGVALVSFSPVGGCLQVLLG